MAKNKPAASTESGGSSKSKLPLVLIVLLVLVLVLGAGGAWFLLGRAPAHAEAAAEPPPPPPAPTKPIFVDVAPMTVNLESEGRAKFLHLGLTLKVRDDMAKAQIAEFMPELRSRLLLLLSHRRADELMSSADKQRLAEQILAELNRPMSEEQPELGVTRVAFTTFVVQ